MKGMLEYPSEPPMRCMPSTTEGYVSAVEFLCHRMRVDEQYQHMVVMGADPSVDEFNPRAAAVGMLNIKGTNFFLVDDNSLPICAGGFAIDPVMPGVWQSWMVGSQAGWDKHWMDMTKATRWLMGALMSGGARRLETTVIGSRTDAQRWYTDFLGMKYEGTRREYAPGEDLKLYSFTQSDWLARFGEGKPEELT